MPRIRRRALVHRLDLAALRDRLIGKARFFRHPPMSPDDLAAVWEAFRDELFGYATTRRLDSLPCPPPWWIPELARLGLLTRQERAALNL